MERFIKKVGVSEKDRNALRSSKVENVKVSQYDFTYMNIYAHALKESDKVASDTMERMLTKQA